ncbi:MAG: hypothetical protein AMXMBFR79_03560 [Chitinophagaceae bacterium]|nr:TPM domain-containing protein [Chitinophagaceae bacterium]MCZ2299096.1 TPM domain-containing protein [Chitinophagales bacterium]
MLNFLKKKPESFFSTEEKQTIVHAIQQAETNTNGEIRVYIENRCKHTDTVFRAEKIFRKLNMYNTENRNGVLVYMAVKDKKLAVYGDKGIYEKAGIEFWEESVQQMIQHFNKNNFSKGIAEVVLKIGNALKQHFPYNNGTDINELPDDIVFGK